MGLRMLYFLLANIMPMFHYLKYGLAIILAFVAVKLGFAHHKDILEIPIGISLGVIAGVLALSIVASMLFKPKPKPLPPKKEDDKPDSV
jgi:tellurite resistance protein TerC